MESEKMSESHRHCLEIIWEENQGFIGWKRVRCTDQFCEYEEDVFYGDDLE